MKNRSTIVEISAPCSSCVELWLDLDTLEKQRDLEQAEFDPRQPVTVRLTDGRRFSAEFYPHPDCLQHLDLPEFNQVIEAGALSPFRSIWFEDTPHGGPAIACAMMEVSSGAVPRRLILGRGIDWSPESAKVKAVAELLERYSAHRAPRERLHWGSHEDFASQIPPTIPAVGGEARWWSDVAGTSGQRRMLPLEYLQLESLCTVKSPIVRTDSSGYAVHRTREQAVRAGLLELIERSTVAEIWTRRLQFRVSSMHLPEAASAALAVCARQGFSSEVYVVPVGNLTVCAVVLHGDGLRSPRPIIFGTAAAESNDEASERAAMESYAELQEAFRTRRASPGTEAATVVAAVEDLHLETSRICAPREASVSDEEVFVADRGNVLTDYLGLVAVQVVSPLRTAAISEWNGRG